MKIFRALLLTMFCTLAVYGLAHNSTKYAQVNIAVNPAVKVAHCKAKIAAQKKPVTIIKAECKQESTSLFSRLFTFEIPKLPLEDFFLAAQKALIEKLF